MVVLQGDLIKCVVVGEDGVGKTSMLMNYATNRFPSKHVPNVFDNYAGYIQLPGKQYSLQLLDTTQRGEGSSERLHIYPGTDIFLVCFSVVQPETFKQVQRRWIPEIQLHMRDTPFLIVGTQTDLREDAEVIGELRAWGQKPVSTREAAAFARRIGAAGYMECSPVMKKRLRRVMNDAFVSVFSSKEDHFGPSCIIL